MTRPPKPDPRPANDSMRRPEPNLIDQRQQQIDPAGQHRQDRNARPDANRKQPGGSGPGAGQRIEKDTRS